MKTLVTSYTRVRSAARNDRLFALDLLKAISIVAVVSFHAIFIPRATYGSSFQVMELLAAPLRFCVPVLFTISFLLLERSLAFSVGQDFGIQRRMERLGKPLIFWFALATFVKFITGDSLQTLGIALLQGQIFQGAYYILVLLQFLLVFVWIRKNSYALIMGVVIQGLVFLGVLCSLNYWFGSQIVDQLRFIHRPFFIYWFAYAALGILFWKNWSLLKEYSQKISVLAKAILLFSSGLIMAWEYNYLFTITQGRVAPFEYVMYSCILSVLVFFLCFASVNEDHFSAPVRQIISTLSNYSLGIFCVNGVFSDYFLAVGDRMWGALSFDLGQMIGIKIVGWVFLLAFSLGFSLLLERVGLKEVVR